MILIVSPFQHSPSESVGFSDDESANSSTLQTQDAPALLTDRQEDTSTISGIDEQPTPKKAWPTPGIHRGEGGCPRIDSLERRWLASDKAWMDAWLEDEEDPTEPAA